MDNRITEMAGYTISEIMARLRVLYGTVAPDVFTSYKARLQTSFTTSNPLRDHIKAHRIVHRIALDTNQPMSEHDKIEAFRDSLLPCGHFKTAIMIYNTAHPGFGDRTFATFTEAMEAYESVEPTSKTLGYAAAVQPPAIGELSRLDSLERSMGTLTALMARMVDGKARDRSGGGGGGVEGGGFKKKSYCHTHGPGGHGSHECLKPGPNHRENATFKNKMGEKGS